MAALAALSGAALASDSVLRGASDVIDKRVIPRVVNSLATRLGDARVGVLFFESRRWRAVAVSNFVVAALARWRIAQNRC